MKKYILTDHNQASSAHINYAEQLNDEQLGVVKNSDGACLVLAGAGSGKTRTLVYRVAYLLEKGVNPESILLATFTNKAAMQMKDRVEVLLKRKVKDMWCGTFHHICNRILRIYGKLSGISPDFNIMDEEDAKTLIKASARDLKINIKGKFFPSPRMIQNIISYSVNTRRTIDIIIAEYYPEFLETAEDIKKIHSEYINRKIAAKNMDYDDLLSETLRLFNQSDEARHKITNKFKYVLVDEYQDTNKLQFEIIKILCERHNNILAVGDDAQSIYAFRGASVENILNFPDEFTNTKIFKLEKNYRSVQGILNLANRSISFNTQQYEKNLSGVKGEGALPCVVNVKDMYAQAAFVAQRAMELHESGIGLNEIAVLFRAHYQSAELEMELMKRGIPYQVRGGIRFFEQAHVKDVLSYLRILSNPSDEVAWIRALSLQEGVGPGFSSKIFQNYQAQCKEIKDIFDNSRWSFLKGKIRTGFLRFCEVVSAITDQKIEGRIDLMIEGIVKTGYENYCMHNFDSYKDRIDDLKELINFSHTYKSLNKFLSDTSLGESFKGETISQPSEDNSFLVLSTIHQAKGLEWDAVMLIGLIDNQFPHPKSSQDLKQLEEERRLFYVATTRAKKELYLIHPMTRYDYNYGVVIARPSMFLSELSLDCYEEWQTDISCKDESSQVFCEYD